MILRFDDTNPSKEKAEFEEAIKYDLNTLDIKPDKVSHSSDYFDELAGRMRTLISQGKAYCDNTPADQMRENRDKGIASDTRESPVDDHLQIFEKMCTGEALDYCVRGKIDMKAKNKCLRDPVFFRCKVDIPHARTGLQYKAYPTYDFACPILDSVEGVTHALRTTEYRDRRPMYEWVQEALGLRPVQVIEFSKTQFEFTCLSKRKLTWFVDEGHVDSWSDPRMPTVSGILRRGMTVPGLHQFALTQGGCTKTNLVSWDKIYAINRKMLDPTCHRWDFISEDTYRVHLLDHTPEDREVRLHPKEDLGVRQKRYGTHVLIEASEASTLDQGSEVVLLGWGNFSIESIDHETRSMSAKFNADGDFKKPPKLNWITDEGRVPCILREFDHLITQPIIDEANPIEDLVNPQTQYDTPGFCEPGCADLAVGDRIQFQRRGFFILDQKKEDGPLIFIFIPDGKAKPMTASLARKVEALHKKVEA